MRASLNDPVPLDRLKAVDAPINFLTAPSRSTSYHDGENLVALGDIPMIKTPPQTDQPLVSIVIRCRNEARHIVRLLEGIRDQTYSNIEIILVDSGSTDQTVSLARSHIDRLVRLDPSEFSFGRSLNRGCREASGDILVFASAHVYPADRNWLEQLISPVRAGAAVSYGRQIGNHQTKRAEHAVFASWFPEVDISSQTHPFCNNANVALLREWWQRFAFDEDLPGLEDLAWTTRVMEAGGTLSYRATATVVHIHEESYRQIYLRYLREARSLHQQFPELRLGPLMWFRWLLAALTTDLLNAKTEGDILSGLGEILRFRAAQYAAAFSGLPKGRHDLPFVASIYLDPNARRMERTSLTPFDRHVPPAARAEQVADRLASRSVGS